jgi:NADP-dependent 3-hydroxy acid dehydrogenase YdfG
MKKVALVTGTSSGFGKLIAQTLAANGIQVFAGMRNITTKNAAVANELNALKNIKVIELDVANEAQVQAAVQGIKSEVETIDILVNNAGVFGLGLVEQFTNAEIQAQFNINFFGLLNVTRAVLPIMRHHKSGLIINISSGLGRITMPFNGVYGATKYAVEAISQALRHELTMVGLDLVVIEPGAFPTTNAAGSSAQYNAANTQIASEYGDLAVAFPSIMANSFQQMIDYGYAADPQIIADKVMDVVEMPSEERPFRIVADPASTGKLEKYNAFNDELQYDLLKGLQMDFMYREPVALEMADL